MSLDSDRSPHDAATIAEEQLPDRKPSSKENDGNTSRETDGKPPEGKGGGEDEKGNKDSKEHEESAKKSRPWVWVIAGIVAVLAITGGVYYWLSTRDLESTDDAYTDGRAITISPKVSGYATELLVGDNQRVVAGQVLARIDQRDYVVAVNQAQANVAVAKAQQRSAEYNAAIARKNFPARLQQAQAQLDQARGQLFQAQADYKRQHGIAPGATTQQNVDQSTAQLTVAQGQVAAAEAAVVQAQPVQENIGNADQQISQIEGQARQAQAQLDQANLNLGYTTIVAPQDGWITKRNIEVGNYLQVGASIFSIVTPEVWITANFKESQLNHMRERQPVRIRVDAYPGLKLEGHVDSVQLGSGSKFTAFPPENATGNFVKIVQRVPVKIVIDRGMDPNLPLPLGISVVPSVTVK